MRWHWLVGLALGLAAVSVEAQAAQTPPLLLISIDGLRPGDILEAAKRGLKVPTLRRMVEEGSYATGVTGELPTVTYPSHTTLITGVTPAVHGIVNNLSFDPFRINQGGWTWYASDIKVPTLWDAAHAKGIVTANEHWPVSVGTQAIDYNLPQIWRTGTADDAKLLRALATPGLLDSLERDLGPYAAGIDESIKGDENRARFAVRLIETKHPGFMTAYFTALDHQQHMSGPDTPEAHAVLERIDTIVAKLSAAARKVNPNTIIAVVSDHGFAPLHSDVNLPKAFADAGLIKFGVDGKVVSWDAAPWPSGGTAEVILRNPKDKATLARVSALLAKLAADPKNGILKILPKTEIEAEGGDPAAQFFVAFRLGYEMGFDPAKPMISPSHYRGMHGYLAELPEMRSTFILVGPGIPAHHDLGIIKMIDIAPTLARLMKVSLPKAQGHPLAIGTL